MTEDTQRGEAVGRLAHRPTDVAVAIAVLLAIVDGLMTLPVWHLEGNPVVLGLGPLGMLAVKLLAGAGLVLCYFCFVRGEWTARYGRPFVWALTALYTVVVYTNVLVLLT